MTHGFTEIYVEPDDPNEKYHILRREAKDLRKQADCQYPDNPELRPLLQSYNEECSGDLVVFLGNDFGMPTAWRPEGTTMGLQESVHQAVLHNKYRTNERLNKLREALKALDVRIHKVIPAVCSGDQVEYHLPEGKQGDSDFVAVTEAVGLMDYTTSSTQAGTLSHMY